MKQTPAAVVLLTTLSMFASSGRAGPRAYVANRYNAAVTVIDTATRAVVAFVPVGLGPMAAAVHPDGSEVFVTMGPEDAVAVIATDSNSLVDVIPVGDNPSDIDLSSDGQRAYVVNTGSRSLSVVDTAARSVLRTVALANHPFGVTLHPDDRTVYVSGDYPGLVSAIDAASGAVTATLTLGVSLGALAMHPTEGRLYVADSGSDELVVVDTASLSVVDRIAVGDSPVGVAVHPDGATVYVTNTLSVGVVSVIDTQTAEVVGTVTLPGLALAQGAALDPGGEVLYVALRAIHSVLTVDTATNQILGAIPVGGHPTGFGPFIGPSAASSSDARRRPRTAHRLDGPSAPRVLDSFLPRAEDVGEVAVPIEIDLMPNARVTVEDDIVYANNECIFVMDLNTGRETPITGRPLPSDPSRPLCDDPQLQPVRHATVSRTRDRIVFNVGEDTSGNVVTRLFLIDLPSRQVYELLPGFARIGVGGIDFSLNGDIYTAGVSLGDPTDPRVAEQSEIFRISSDLTSWAQVTALPNRGSADVSVSADGTRLAFNTLVLSTANHEIVETRLDGSNPRVVIQGGALWLDSVHDPEHSGDGSEVVYSRIRARLNDGSECPPNWGDHCQDLFRQRVSGGSPIRLGLVGDTQIVPDWKGPNILYHFRRGHPSISGSWLGSMVTDQNGTTIVPFGTNNLFAKWIE